MIDEDCGGYDEVQEDYYDDSAFNLDVIEDAAAVWMRQRNSSGHSSKVAPNHSAAADTAAAQPDTHNSSGYMRDGGADATTAAAAAAAEVAGPHGLLLTLHDNPHVQPTANDKQGKKGSNKGNSSNKGGLDMAVSATAAVGGLVALTGSLLSYAVARARGNKEKNRLKEGLRKKEASLSAMQRELAALKATAKRMVALEAELAASNSHLLAMNQEVERARAASRRIEGDMAVFQDQLQGLNSTKAEISAAMAAAEAKAVQAEQRRQEAEAHRKHAETRWQTAKQLLEQAQTEVETLKGELGLRGSQLISLTRELEFTRGQLANAEKCVETAQMETRQQRTGYGSYDAWD